MRRSILILISIVVFQPFLFADNPGLNYMLYLQNAKNKFNEIQSRLKQAVDLINKKGSKAFPELKKLNSKDGGSGIFVIDPVSGKLLVAPPAKNIGKDALDNSDINGKALAREAIKEARIKLYQSESWSESLTGELYRDYFYKLAITLNAKIYVVAIGMSNKDMQRLFVTKIVDDACKIIEEDGKEKAFKIFSRKEGLYHFKNTYLFIYQIKSKDEVISLFNPNYPEDIDKNIINLKVENIFIVKEILKLLNHQNNGWIRSYAHIPTNKSHMAPKDIYVKAIEINGEKLVIGSGVYLDK